LPRLRIEPVEYLARQHGDMFNVVHKKKRESKEGFLTLTLS
jgi:hypothetical protein